VNILHGTSVREAFSCLNVFAASAMISSVVLNGSFHRPVRAKFGVCIFSEACGYRLILLRGYPTNLDPNERATIKNTVSPRFSISALSNGRQPVRSPIIDLFRDYSLISS